MIFGRIFPQQVGGDNSIYGGFKPERQCGKRHFLSQTSQSGRAAPSSHCCEEGLGQNPCSAFAFVLLYVSVMLKF